VHEAALVCGQRRLRPPSPRNRDKPVIDCRSGIANEHYRMRTKPRACGVFGQTSKVLQ